MVNKKIGLIITLVSIGLFIVYYYTSGGGTPYNHFVLLADAFLKGNFFVEGVYPWIEKAPIDELRFFIVNPPMPAILLVPFVKIWGLNFQQHLFAHGIGVLLALSTFFMSLKIKMDLKLAVWSSILIGIGSIVWFLSATGSVWYLGQTTAALFLTLAIIEILKDKPKPYLVGLSLGAAYLSRIHLALIVPIFAFLVWKKYKSIKALLQLGITIAPFVLFDLTYNFIRYGSIFNQGYFLIPGTQNEPWFSRGIMHPSYIIEDLKVAFLMLPKKISEFPYFIPSWGGMAMWLTTPAFVFVLFADIKNIMTKLSWLAIFMVFLVVGAHGGTGFAQFGYRFAVDFYPFLTYLTISGVARLKGPKFIHWLLLAIGIVVNLWGVLWINIFGWVGW